MAKSRIEAILENILGGKNMLEQPQSRMEELLIALLEKLIKPTRIYRSATVDKKTIPAHGRVMLELSFDIPEGYEIVSFRGINIQKGTGASGDEWKMVVKQFEQTSGGGLKAQVPVVNTGDTDAIIKMQVVVAADIAVSA